MKTKRKIDKANKQTNKQGGGTSTLIIKVNIYPQTLQLKNRNF